MYVCVCDMRHDTYLWRGMLGMRKRLAPVPNDWDKGAVSSITRAGWSGGGTLRLVGRGGGLPFIVIIFR